MTADPHLATINPAPRIVGIVGEAGSGKDTVASFLLEHVEGHAFALADPMKEFASRVFGFTAQQLWGPSSFRNAVDERYTLSVRSVKRGSFTWLKLFFASLRDNKAAQADLADAVGHRDEAWWCFDAEAVDWLNDVLPPGYSRAEGVIRLRQWMAGVMRQPKITPRYVLQTLGTEWGRAISDTIWIDRAVRTARDIVASGRWAVIKDVRFLNEARLLRAAGADIWRVTRPGLNADEVNNAGVAHHPSEREQRSTEMNALVTREIYNDRSFGELNATVRAAIVDG